MTYESSDLSAGVPCPNCSAIYPTGTELIYVPQADEYVCRDCSWDLKAIDK